jgi:hypothetical protein
MDSLLGGEVPAAAKFVIAFVVVLLLIALLAWLVRRLGSGGLSGAARGRQPRLAVVDATTVDARRRLILVRRDNVEHLLMIGGPTDLVIEPNILRGAAAPREAPARSVPAPAEPIPPPAPLDDAAVAVASPSPTPPAPPAPAPPATAESEPQLADMAQRLEASLRREPRLDVTAETPPTAEVPAVEPPLLMPPPAADAAVPEVHPEPPLAPRPGHDKSFYEDLEREMANLLNRPTGKP